MTAGKPTVHGVYNYWMGGSQHSRADRELGRSIAEHFPQVPVHVWAAQEFHLRVTRWAAERGISRFIHGGPVTVLPGGCNVHDAARAVNPAAEVIYVNWEAEAHEFAQEMLTGGKPTRAVLAAPGDMNPAPAVTEMLATGEPVLAIAGLAMHFMDAGTAARMTAHVAAALPSGSVGAVSLAVPGDSPQAAELLEMFAAARVFRHTAQDVTGWLEKAGMEIVPPGVCDVRLHPGKTWAAGELGARPPGFIAGGLALKP